MKKKQLSLILAGVLVASVVLNPFSFNTTKAMADVVVNSNSGSTDRVVNQNYVYLSDLQYESSSRVGWGEIKKDSNIEGGKIKLIVDGELLQYDKGMGAHATSTLVYDISEYSDTYTRFVARMGVDYSKKGNGNGVKFKISTSDNGKDWTDKQESNVVNPESESISVDLNVEGVKYIRLIANDNGNNGADHAVYGDARLVKADYDLNSEFNSNIQRTDYYDAILREKSVDENVKNNEKLILTRALVNKAGFQTLQRLYKNEDNKAGIDYLLNNERALKLFITGGGVAIEGSYADSVTAFCKLYNAHGKDFDDATDNYFNLRLGTSISLAYGREGLVRFWNTSDKEINPVSRYDTYKKLMSSGVMDKAGEGNGHSKWSTAQFKSLSMPLMKWVVDARMNEDELQWLADYALNKKASGSGDFLNAYSYIRYTMGYNYNNPKLYDQANKETYDKKYNFSKYYNDYGNKDVKRLWMVFEEGSVCGGLAKTYANLAEVFGRPSSGVGQPGHAATITYMWNNKTNQYEWGIQNDIYGWARSGNEFRDRMLNWGNQSWCNWQSAGYVALATDAVETEKAYANYQKATIYNLLADSYTDEARKEEAYNKALSVQNINYDSFIGLVNLYRNSPNKTDDDRLKLGKKLVDAYTYYPYALDDLSKLLRAKIADKNILAQFDLMKNTALIKAKSATSKDVKQPDICKKVAESITGSTSVNLASFSFDGDNAGKIVIDPSYNESTIRVKYSLDGGNNWIETDDHIISLTPEQISSITAENDIKVGLVGSSDIFTIDIQKGASPNDATLYKNDLENRLLGKIEHLEYSLDEGKTWKDYTDETKFDGFQVVKVRYKANGTYLQSGIGQNTFKNDSTDATRKYIPLKNIELYKYSSQQSDNKDHAAKNMLDGTELTAWHTKYGASNDQKFYSVEFDKARYITSVEYKPAAVNGRLRDAEVYTSMDGENWTLSGKATELNNDTTIKTINLDNPTESKFVKIVATQTWGNSVGERNKFFSGKMFNFFEDTTAGASKSQLSTEEMSEFEEIIGKIKQTEKPSVSDVENEASNSAVSEDENKENTVKYQLSAEEMNEFGNIISKIESTNN